jgi:aminopeptidase N
MSHNSLHKHLRLLALLLLPLVACAQVQNDYFQNHQFTEADSLRGMLRPERTCFDVTFYDLNLRVLPSQQSLSGSVGIAFEAKADFSRLQIDLFENMAIDKIVDDANGGSALDFERKHNAVFVNFPERVKKGSAGKITVHYHGKPIVAKRAPWDGGFVWAKDDKGRDWIGVACEGVGASLWWPNKDHLSDEPDSLHMAITVPKDLTCVANGNLVKTLAQNPNERTFVWKVSYPINNYNVTLNIAHYAHFSETYHAADGDALDLDYYVLDYNLGKAQLHFKQTPRMLQSFEKYFGKYPFWNDGYALVETPYLGMEHQGAIAYGNKYMRGYMGGLVPAEFDFDYLILHESGHEYWGNSISCKDHAEMWIHESFTTYMESLYIEDVHGPDAALRYLASQRPYIISIEPIIGPLDVNFSDWASSDEYYKGAWVLHTLRNAIGDDAVWFGLLKSFYQKHARSNITTKDFTSYVNTYTGKNWDTFFEQYLYRPNLPVLECKLKKKGRDCELSYRWHGDVPNFSMPVAIGKKGHFVRVEATSEWQQLRLKKTACKDVKVDESRFLVGFQAL